jgi:putative glutamine amidotransferase
VSDVSFVGGGWQQGLEAQVDVRPKVVIPARFSASASALRYRAIVNARALSEAVLLAGGEPLTVHPWAPGGVVSAREVAQRLDFADAVLLPGGGDLAPQSYGQQVTSQDVYDVDVEQDGFDLAVAQWALGAGVPVLAICRGLQVVNVARGGDLRQDMTEPHRYVVHDLQLAPDSALAVITGGSVRASCFHHQELDRLGDGLRAVAWSAEGVVEAVELRESTGWFLGVQWHPEDTHATDPAQAAILRAFVAAA